MMTLLNKAISSSKELAECSIKKKDFKAALAQEQIAQWLKELKEYKKLEEKLNNMFGGNCTLADVVESLERQITEPSKDHPVNARILTYEDAEKWDEYRNLEEKGRLLKLPCKIGDTLWWLKPGKWENGRLTEEIARCPVSVKAIAIDENGSFYVYQDEEDYCPFDLWDKVGEKYALLSKEEAEGNEV